MSKWRLIGWSACLVERGTRRLLLARQRPRPRQARERPRAVAEEVMLGERPGRVAEDPAGARRPALPEKDLAEEYPEDGRRVEQSVARATSRSHSVSCRAWSSSPTARARRPREEQLRHRSGSPLSLGRRERLVDERDRLAATPEVDERRRGRRRPRCSGSARHLAPRPTARRGECRRRLGRVQRDAGEVLVDSARRFGSQPHLRPRRPPLSSPARASSTW